MNTQSRIFVLYKLHQSAVDAACIATLMLSLAACNGGGGDATAERVADFDKEVYSHQFWSQLSPEVEPRDEFKELSPEYTEIVETDRYSCSDEIYSMTDTPKEFVAINPDESIMWLGNLIQGDSHLQPGSLEELSIRERAPLNISISLLRADNFRIVEQPSLLTVNSAIGELIQNAVEAGHEASTDVYFESMEAHSTQQSSLKLGFTAEYLGGNAETSLSVDKQGEEHTFFAYFIQNAFTVSMGLPTAPHDMVSDALTHNKLDDLKARGKIGEENPPLYISSMSYGRVLVYKMTSTHEKKRIQAAINASYNGLKGGGSGYAEAELKDTLSTARITISAFGGNQSNIEALIRDGDLKSYFTGDTKLTSMKPISFEVRNLQDNTIAGISRTTEYNVKQCIHNGKTTPAIGEVINVYFDSVKIPTDCDAGIDKGDIFGRFDVINTNEAGEQVTNRVHTIERSKSVKVQSGNTLNLGAASGKSNKYYGKTFRISATLKDADGGANGADDTVGNWNANKFDISGLKSGTYTRKAVSNCKGNNPTLTYRLKIEGYIY
jgi:hypothetical protein